MLKTQRMQSRQADYKEMLKIKVLARVSTFSFYFKMPNMKIARSRCNGGETVAWFKLNSEIGKLHRYSQKTALMKYPSNQELKRVVSKCSI